MYRYFKSDLSVNCMYFIICPHKCFFFHVRSNKNQDVYDAGVIFLQGIP